MNAYLAISQPTQSQWGGIAWVGLIVLFILILVSARDKL